MHSTNQRPDILDIDTLLEEYGENEPEWISSPNYESRLLIPSSSLNLTHQTPEYLANSQMCLNTNDLSDLFENNSNTLGYVLDYPGDIMFPDASDMWSQQFLPLDDIESSETSDYEQTYIWSPNEEDTEFPLPGPGKSDNSCNENPYQASRPNLSEHRKTAHKKRVQCKVPSCGHMTAKQRDMDRHIKAKHPHTLSEVVRFFCQVKGCKSGRKGFTRSDNLTRHMKKVHKGLK